MALVGTVKMSGIALGCARARARVNITGLRSRESHQELRPPKPSERSFAPRRPGQESEELSNKLEGGAPDRVDCCVAPLPRLGAVTLQLG